MRRIDPATPVHEQSTLTVREGNCVLHHWFMYANGVHCPKCDALLLRTSGRRAYRGLHRAKTERGFIGKGANDERG